MKEGAQKLDNMKMKAKVRLKETMTGHFEFKIFVTT